MSMRHDLRTMTLSAVAFMVLATSAVGELLPRADGMIYDTDLDITWIADTNLAETLGASEYGIMRWEEARDWVDGLSYGGYDDWRLPRHTAPDPGCTSFQGVPRNDSRGFNCTLSEMGHLFYVELGGTAGEAIIRSRNPRVDLFLFENDISVDYRGHFWTCDSRPLGPANILVWKFSFGDGVQGESQGGITLGMLIVRDGDVSSESIVNESWWDPLGRSTRRWDRGSRITDSRIHTGPQHTPCDQQNVPPRASREGTAGTGIVVRDHRTRSDDVVGPNDNSDPVGTRPRWDRTRDRATTPTENAPVRSGLVTPTLHQVRQNQVTRTTVTLFWEDNSTREFGVLMYRMDPEAARRTHSAQWELVSDVSERIGSNIRGTGLRSDEDYDLTPGTNYCYRLRAYVGFDRSEMTGYSGIVCAQTLP